MSESRWFRVNCDWSDSDWIYVLSAEARLAWIYFLGRVKTHGFGGRLKRVPETLLARQWLLGEEAVLQILKAAQNNGAVTIDGDTWVVENWAKYQGDTSGAARQQSHRERKKRNESEDSGSNDEERNGSNALRNGVTITETETETETNKPPVSPLPGGAPPPVELPTAVSWWENTDEPIRSVLVEIATVARFKTYMLKNPARSKSKALTLWRWASLKILPDSFVDHANAFASYYRTTRRHDDGVAAFSNWLRKEITKLPDLKNPPASAHKPPDSEAVASLVSMLRGLPEWAGCDESEITNEAIRRVNSGGAA